MSIAMEPFFHPTTTPAEALFTFCGLLVVATAMMLIRDEWDSPRGLALRLLVICFWTLTTPLFNVFAWRFSPRVEWTAVVVDFNWKSADMQHPPVVTFQDGSRRKLGLVVPSAARRLLRRGEPVEVTYLSWSHRAVALRATGADAAADPEAFSRASMEFALKDLAEQLLVNVVGFALAVLAYLWIRRNNRKPAPIDLAIPRSD